MDEAILVQKVNASYCLYKKVECLVFGEVLLFVADYEK
jgi:hypothetical protein